MFTVQDFFSGELAAIDHNIQRMQNTIHAEPSANGRHAGMRALIEVQNRHRQIVELLAAKASSLSAALDLCRGQLILAEQRHMHSAARGGAFSVHCADEWWTTLNDIEYLAHLMHGLREAIDRAGKHPG